jgi:sterol desaturase/sphingolipid hydroxylase (fatty acid hydroxylase superfamily)
MTNSFQHFISSFGPQIQLAFFVAIFFIVWNIENIAGIFFNYKKWKHAFVNAPFILTNIPGQIFLGFVFTKTIEWTSLHHFGFLYFLHLKSSAGLFLTSFIFLDFGEYIYHRLMHRIKGLWMFHVVHHSDSVVDVSTTLREHPGENIIRLTFTLLWVLISGVAFWALLLRQIIQSFSTVFAHMNYRLPERLDRFVGFIFITPNLHQVHHHFKQPYTDSNYGDVLSIWDRMFGSFQRLDAKNLVFGVDTYMEKKENGNFIFLTKMPFGKYRSKEIIQEKEIKREVIDILKEI